MVRSSCLDAVLLSLLQPIFLLKSANRALYTFQHHRWRPRTLNRIFSLTSGPHILISWLLLHLFLNTVSFCFDPRMLFGVLFETLLAVSIIKRKLNLFFIERIVLNCCQMCQCRRASCVQVAKQLSTLRSRLEASSHLRLACWCSNQ